MGHFFDEFAKRQINFAKEIERIEALFNKHNRYRYSLLDAVYHSFLKIDSAIIGTCVSFDDFKDVSGITKITQLGIVSPELFFYYCECILAIINCPAVNNYIKNDYHYEDILSIIFIIKRNAIDIIQKLNHEVQIHKNGKCYIFESNHEITAAADVVQNKYELGEQLYLYHHTSLKGNLNKKSDILCRLYKWYESIESILKANNQGPLESAIGCLSNKTDTRHAPGERETKVIEGIDAKQMEEVYDSLFDLYLTAIILANYYDKKKVKTDAWVTKFKV